VGGQDDRYDRGRDLVIRNKEKNDEIIQKSLEKIHFVPRSNIKRQGKEYPKGAKPFEDTVVSKTCRWPYGRGKIEGITNNGSDIPH